LAPFWFGGDRDLAWNIDLAWFPGVALLYELGLFATRRRRPVAIGKIGFSAISCGLVGGWILLQTSPWVPKSWQNPIWQVYADTIGHAVPGTISIEPATTIATLLWMLPPVASFWLALQLCRDPDRARLIVGALATIGGLYAAYGIIAFFAFPHTILWFEKLYYVDSVTATFVNRNSYATYAGIGLICALAMTISHYARGLGNHMKSPVRSAAAFIAITAGTGGAWLALCFIVAMALILTGSRGGISASSVGAGIVLLIFILRGRIRPAMSFMIVSLSVLVIGLTFFAFGDFLAARLSTLAFDVDGRLAVYRLTLMSIFDAPLLGFGFGTFKYVFPMYRDNSLSAQGVWDLAHNTYLELFQGLGIPMALLYCAAIAVLVVKCLRAAIERQSSSTVPIAASAASAILLLHACVDFSAQMQAIALTWAALLGAGVAQSWSSRVSTAAN
jgi:O-antigen ligase